MRKTILILTLILTALAALPVLAGGSRVVLTGTLERATLIHVTTESAGPFDSSHTDRVAVVRLSRHERGVFRWRGSLTPDGGVVFVNGDGSETFARPGDRVRVFARFDCLTAGGDDGCPLRALRVVALD